MSLGVVYYFCAAKVRFRGGCHKVPILILLVDFRFCLGRKSPCIL